LLVTLETWRARLLLFFAGAGPLAAIVLLVGIGLTRLRDAWVSFGLLLFWAAYPFIQFHGRHTFHLEFLVIAAFMALFSLVARSAIAIWHGQRPAMIQILRSTALVAGLIALSVVVIVLARAIQRPGVRTLLDSYEGAAVEPLGPAASLFPPAEGGRIAQAMIRLDADCQSPAEVTIRYVAPKPTDFTRHLTLPTRSRTYMPVYTAFAGVDGPSCVRAWRVSGIDQLLWMDATLSQGPEARPLNERVYIGTAFPTRIWLKLAQWWPSISNLG
jgi:hypothetical protein